MAEELFTRSCMRSSTHHPLNTQLPSLPQPESQPSKPANDVLQMSTIWHVLVLPALAKPEPGQRGSLSSAPYAGCPVGLAGRLWGPHTPLHLPSAAVHPSSSRRAAPRVCLTFCMPAPIRKPPRPRDTGTAGSFLAFWLISNRTPYGNFPETPGGHLLTTVAGERTGAAERVWGRGGTQEEEFWGLKSLPELHFR